jgi:hypothetical protein
MPPSRETLHNDDVFYILDIIYNNEFIEMSNDRPAVFVRWKMMTWHSLKERGSAIFHL